LETVSGGSTADASRSNAWKTFSWSRLLAAQLLQYFALCAAGAFCQKQFL
jgi:hypothetical protein